MKKLLKHFDSDAIAFFVAAGITDVTQKKAINDLVRQLKAAGIWTKMKAIYPLVGGTASTHKWNLKDPQDTDAAYRLTFTGGWTHSSTGITGNATDTYANTFFNPNTSGSLNSGHLSIFIRNNTDGVYTDMGVGSADATHQQVVYARLSGLFYVRINDIASSSVANSDSRGFYVSSRTSSTAISGYKDATAYDYTVNSVSLPNGNIYIGAINYLGTGAILFTDREYILASIGEGLSATEAGNFNTAAQAFKTTLGR